MMTKKCFNIAEDGNCILPKTIAEIEDFTDWNEDLPKRVAYFNESTEERNGVTYLALFVEMELFRIVKIIFPDFPKYLGNANFSSAINYLRSFKLIPDHILDATKCIKDIRNEFAHNIDTVNLSDLQLTKDLLKDLNHFVDTYKGDYDYVEIEDTLLSRFKTVCMNIIAALRIYEPSIKIVREHLDSGKFQK